MCDSKLELGNQMVCPELFWFVLVTRLQPGNPQIRKAPAFRANRLRHSRSRSFVNVRFPSQRLGMSVKDKTESPTLIGYDFRMSH
jgi:hypothetical protein